MNIFSLLNIYFDNIQPIIMVFWAYFEYNSEIDVPIEHWFAPLWHAFKIKKMYQIDFSRFVLRK